MNPQKIEFILKQILFVIWIKYALIYEHINQEMGVDQIITEQLSIYLTRHLWYIDLEKQHV